jgi:hypothetical protein
VKYELGFYIPEDDILHSHRREKLKSCLEVAMSRFHQSRTTNVPDGRPESSVALQL